MNPADAVRLTYGSVLVVAPRAVLRGWATDATPAKRRVARLVGARHLLQGLVSMTAPAPKVRRAGAVVDALHALSGVVTALSGRSWRTIACGDAGIALMLAGANVRSAETTPRLAHGGRVR